MAGQSGPKTALVPLGTPSPASRRRKHASVQFGAKKIANKGHCVSTSMPDASRSLKHPFRALPGRRAPRDRASSATVHAKLAALDAAAAARGTADCDGKEWQP